MGKYGFLPLLLAAAPDAPRPHIVSDGGAFHHWNCLRRVAVSCRSIKKAVAYSSVATWASARWGFSPSTAGICRLHHSTDQHTASHRHALPIVGVVTSAAHTREISEYGGLMKVMPIFTVIFAWRLSSMGCRADGSSVKSHPGRRLPGFLAGHFGGVGICAGARLPAVAVPRTCSAS